MQIKLNEETKKAMALAKVKAVKLQYAELGAEHILIGILAAPNAVLAETLEILRLNAVKLSGDIENNMPSGSGGPGKGELPLSRSAKEVFQAAAQAAQTQNASEVGPEHLMLGILSLEKNSAYLILKSATNGNEGKVKAELTKCLERIRKRRTMTSLFNEQASTAIIGARDEAEKSRSEYIEPAHILLGITSHPGSVAMAALLRLKVNMKVLNPNLQRLVAESPKRKSKEATLSFSDDTKKVMDKTVEMSEQLNSRYIGPEHLLLGIMALDGTKAYNILKDSGVPGFKQLMEEIKMVLASNK